MQALAALSHLSPEEVDRRGRGAGSARPATLRVLARFETPFLATTGPDPTWLFVLRGDWTPTVRVDGRAVPIHTAQLAFSAVRIPAGAHRVEWREDAPGLEVSRWGPVAALLILGISSVRAGRGIGEAR